MELIIGVISIVLSLWILRGSYREQSSKFGITEHREYIFGIFWLLLWVFILVGGVTLFLFGATPAFYLKPW